MSTDAPDGLQARGLRLWTSLMAQDEALHDDEAPNREVALSACRTADRVEALEREALVVPTVVEGKTGPVIHPVLAEVRQQSALLSRLITSLRLPDEASGRRPQRRSPRGVHSSPTSVSSLDRARQSRAGRGDSG